MLFQPSYLLFSSTLLAIFLLLPTSVNSISFRFPRFDHDTIDIVYEGDAVACEGHIQLNLPDFLTRVGHATYSKSVRIWDPSTQHLTDFTTRFSFTIDTQASPSYGHGLVFFLAPSDTQIPPNSAGGFLGLFNTTNLQPFSTNHILGVEFDSFPNPEWDPPMEHVGVLVSSLSSPAYVPWKADEHSSDVGNAWIDYSARTKRLNVRLTYDHSPERNYEVDYDIDLREILPEWVKIGFSAATGANKESHLVHSWEFKSTLEGILPNPTLERTQPNPTLEGTQPSPTLEGTQPNPTVGTISSNQNRKIKWLAGGIGILGALLIGALILVFWVVLRRRSNRTVEETGETTNHTWTHSDSERGAWPPKFSHGARVIDTKGGQM